MILIALKRLWNRPLLTLLSIVGVVLAVGLVTSIPIFAEAMGFAMLKEELDKLSTQTGRPPFAVRIYVMPSGRYPLSLEQTRELADRIEKTLMTELRLPALSLNRDIETIGVALRAPDPGSPYDEPDALLANTILAVLTGVGSHITILEGESMETAASSGDELNVWMHKLVADETGVRVGERYEIGDLRHAISLRVRIAGIWTSTDPKDRYWQQDPDLSLRRVLLTRETDYQAIAEPVFHSQLGFASWYLIMDDSLLAPDKMQAYLDGLETSVKALAKFLPDVQADSSPLAALGASIKRQADLTALLFLFSVPLMGFLLYFMTLISTVTVQWQRQELAIEVSRGMRSRQLILVGTIESLIVIGIGCPLGILGGIQLARLMGYTQSFMSFAWREALPVSPMSLNVPMVAAAAGATLIARLVPILRVARTGIVEHERTRARVRRKPFWQRFYLDVALLLVVLYAQDQLSKRGTLVPQVVSQAGATRLQTVPWFAGLIGRLSPDTLREQDPLMFLVPALFTLALSLLLIRLFPLLMKLGDWLSAFAGQVTLYLAFRQLARQSNQYTSALLLVITSFSLGAFMASMAASLDQWTIDRVYYSIGTDVLVNQMPKPVEPLELPPPPTEGAWLLPADMYEDIPGVLDAARVALYPTVVEIRGGRPHPGTFIGIDRLDLPAVLFYRADFGEVSLGELMNRLAQDQDGVIVSQHVLEAGKYEIGDTIRLRINVVDVVLHEADYVIVGTYTYFPTVYEGKPLPPPPRSSRTSRNVLNELPQWTFGETAVIGNLQFLYDQIGGTYLHYVWLKIDPDSDRGAMMTDVRNMGVYINLWVDTRDRIAQELSKMERVGIFGTLTVGFLGAALLSGIGLLVYNYASLQERLFRFTALRALGLSLRQVVGQVSIEYLVLMAYSVAGGVGIGTLASSWFIPFFQAGDRNVINPPMLLPRIAWDEIYKISTAFVGALVVAQIVVISSALRNGVFEALRMGDRE